MDAVGDEDLAEALAREVLCGEAGELARHWPVYNKEAVARRADGGHAGRSGLCFPWGEGGRLRASLVPLISTRFLQLDGRWGEGAIAGNDYQRNG